MGSSIIGMFVPSDESVVDQEFYPPLTRRRDHTRILDQRTNRLSRTCVIIYVESEEHIPGGLSKHFLTEDFDSAAAVFELLLSSCDQSQITRIRDRSGQTRIF